jgi:hypothetical protein
MNWRCISPPFYHCAMVVVAVMTDVETHRQRLIHMINLQRRNTKAMPPQWLSRKWQNIEPQRQHLCMIEPQMTMPSNEDRTTKNNASEWSNHKNDISAWSKGENDASEWSNRKKPMPPHDWTAKTTPPNDQTANDDTSAWSNRKWQRFSMIELKKQRLRMIEPQMTTPPNDWTAKNSAPAWWNCKEEKEFYFKATY